MHIKLHFICSQSSHNDKICARVELVVIIYFKGNQDNNINNLYLSVCVFHGSQSDTFGKLTT